MVSIVYDTGGRISFLHVCFLHINRHCKLGHRFEPDGNIPLFSGSIGSHLKET